jgi:GNAT superfamily N-acetyltransferase
VAELRVLSWRHAYRDILPAEGLAGLRAADGVPRWANRAVEPAPTAFFGAVGADDVPVAYCAVGAARDAVDRHPELATGELWAIYADPAVVGTGAGHVLHRAAVDHLAGQGYRHAVLWVFEDNGPSRAFYERHGWRPDGGREEFHWGGRSVWEVRYARKLSQPSSV